LICSVFIVLLLLLLKREVIKMLVYEGILKSGLVDLKAKKEEILELFDKDLVKELEKKESLKKEDDIKQKKNKKEN